MYHIHNFVNEEDGSFVVESCLISRSKNQEFYRITKGTRNKMRKYASLVLVEHVYMHKNVLTTKGLKIEWRKMTKTNSR